MLDNEKISIIDNKFQIIRYEGFGYVQNICNYDNNIFNLEISCCLSEFEGGNCKTIYSFEIIKKCCSIKSIIEYIEVYSDLKYHIYYEYDSNQNKITRTKQKKSYKKNNRKCIIL